MNQHEAYHYYRLAHLIIGAGVWCFGWYVMRRFRLLLILAGVALWSMYGCGQQQAPPPIVQITPTATPTPEVTVTPIPTPSPTPDPYVTHLKYGPEPEIGVRLLRVVEIEMAPGEVITGVWLSDGDGWEVDKLSEGEVEEVVMQQKTSTAMPAELVIGTSLRRSYRLLLRPNARHPKRKVRFDG